MKCLLLLSILSAVACAGHCQGKDVGPIYRYYIPADSAYVTVAGNEQIANGWINKTLLFYAYTEAGPNRVAVYRWYNPVQRRYISVCADELRDEQMTNKGYADKHLQFYALTLQGPGTIKVYRRLNAQKEPG